VRVIIERVLRSHSPRPANFLLLTIDPLDDPSPLTCAGKERLSAPDLGMCGAQTAVQQQVVPQRTQRAPDLIPTAGKRIHTKMGGRIQGGNGEAGRGRHSAQLTSRGPSSGASSSP
jgi:hypothetical protein